MNTTPDRVVADRYVVQSSLGAGGMGAVERAWDRVLRRPVALKELRFHELPRDARERASARLRREARALAALDHPNIVSIYDVCEEGDETFLVLELVEGRTLREAAKAGASLPERVAWLTDVARALAYAHERGIVHRDVKPDNVLVTEAGSIKVIDFGTARPLEGRLPGIETSRGAVTFDGKAIGTPDYMAPEQFGPDEVAPSADQFAWAVTAYEALAGVHPWSTIEGDPSAVEVLGQRLRPRPLASIVPLVPDAIARVIERAMSLEPAHRFASMSEVVAALERARDASRPASALDEPPPTASVVEPRAPLPLAATLVSSAQAPPPSGAPPSTRTTPPPPIVATLASAGSRPPPPPTHPQAPRQSAPPTLDAAPAPTAPMHPPTAQAFGAYAPEPPRASYGAPPPVAAPAPRSPAFWVGVGFLVFVCLSLGACGLCVGVGFLGASSNGDATVACSQEADDFACKVTNHTKTQKNVCWDLKLTCGSGEKATKHVCLSVVAGGFATRRMSKPEAPWACANTSTTIQVEHVHAH